jgi:hypothetical protein
MDETKERGDTFDEAKFRKQSWLFIGKKVESREGDRKVRRGVKAGKKRE